MHRSSYPFHRFTVCNKEELDGRNGRVALRGIASHPYRIASLVRSSYDRA